MLKGLRGLEPLKKLFWSELSYDRINQPLSRHGWGHTASSALAEDPILFAGGGRNKDFHVIYCRLPQSRLLLGQERPVITQLLKEHPYGLFIFSNQAQDHWHFINVKYDAEAEKRRLFRRISVSPEERLRTAAERIAMLDLQAIQPDISDLPPLTIQSKHDEAFDVEAVTRQFFKKYAAIFKILENDLNKQVNDPVWAHDYSLQFLNRCMFIYFIQRKGWLGDDRDFLDSFWKSYRNSGQSQDSFVDNWLNVLFFEAFNNRFHGGHDYFPTGIKDALSLAPYLNGGLFTENQLDRERKAPISDQRFEQILKFLGRYNFTISEDSPLDKEVAVDPEMIGKVYESLVNVSKEVDERGEAGIFYTPRTEIDLMCRLSLVDYLANHLGEKRKELLNQLVFALEPDEKIEADRAVAEAGLWATLNDCLHNITVLDPACGSGSFLVGMLHILNDLQERSNLQLGITKASYARKKRIIGQSLYGVDVMEWACQVAELRLWLALIIDAEIPQAELHVRPNNEPLLPHFSFKIRCGDSLVQEVGGINLGHISTSKVIPSSLKARITALKDEKLKFYNNDAACRFPKAEALKNEEKRLFSDILTARQHALQEDIKSLRRKIEGPAEQRIRLDGTVEQRAHQVDLDAPRYQKQIENLTAELAQVEAAQRALETAREMPFVWDIAFVEIFEGESEGFDIVIGNPPYVRQEAIAAPAVQGVKVTDDKKEYKAKLALSVAQAFPNFFGYKAGSKAPGRKIDAKSDLYIYFYLRGLSLLNSQGSFCFITSNSWLDVGYGADLQEFLLKHCHIKLVLDNQVKRTFANADVNSVIVLLSPPDDRQEWALEKTARFVMFRVPFEHILDPVIFDEIEEATERKVTKEYRVFPIQQGKLLEDGCEIPEEEESGKAAGPLIKTACYIGNKWGGKYLRAPDIYWTILEKGKGKLCQFGSLVSNIQRNNLQNLKTIEAVPKEVCTDGYPFLHSLKDIQSIHFSPEDLPKVIQRKGNEDATWIVPDVISNRFVGNRMFYIEGDNFLVNDSFFIAQLKEGINRHLVLAILNSTLSLLFMELLGRKTYGIGVMYIYGPEFAGQILIDPSIFPRDISQHIMNTYKTLASRPLGTIFEEIGLPKPNTDYSNINIEEIALEKILKDRATLDDILFEAINLSKNEQLEVYKALVELVRNRLSKAGSMKKGKWES